MERAALQERDADEEHRPQPGSAHELASAFPDGILAEDAAQRLEQAMDFANSMLSDEALGQLASKFRFARARLGNGVDQEAFRVVEH
jgi:hypothetical protein